MHNQLVGSIHEGEGGQDEVPDSWQKTYTLRLLETDVDVADSGNATRPRVHALGMRIRFLSRS